MKIRSALLAGVLGLGAVAASTPHATASETVDLAFVTVGAPGNPADTEVIGDGTTGYGDVDQAFLMGKHEVTNAQYAAFLNAKATVDPHLLYHPFMNRAQGFGEGSAIVQRGTPGSFTYTVDPGRENKPVNYVSAYDAMRFANWLHNGQGDGDTETGAYTLVGGTPVPANYVVTRNAGAAFFLPTIDEWYKAAYYDPAAGRYYDYPTGTDAVVVCAPPSDTPNTANCGGAAGDEQIAGGAFTDAGAYTSSSSPVGTFDQGGNVYEWTDSFSSTAPVVGRNVSGVDAPFKILRGASYIDPVRDTKANASNTVTADSEFAAQGFRMAAAMR